MGYASAMGWILLLIIAVFTGINFLDFETLGLLRGRPLMAAAAPIIEIGQRQRGKRRAWIYVVLIFGAVLMSYPLDLDGTELV